MNRRDLIQATAALAGVFGIGCSKVRNATRRPGLSRPRPATTDNTAKLYTPNEEFSYTNPNVWTRP